MTHLGVCSCGMVKNHIIKIGSVQRAATRRVPTLRG